jgi:cell division protein FtsA
VAPTCFSVDDATGIRDPEKFFGNRLGVDMHIVTAEPGPIRNLSRCIAEAHLGVDAIVPAPLVSGLACLSREQREAGVACVEMGAGVTNVALFVRGMLVGLSTIPMGGADITADIMGHMRTPAQSAERLKTLYGSALSSPSDAHDMLDVSPMPGSYDDTPDYNRVSREELSDVIRTRLGRIFEAVQTSFESMGFVGPAASHVVLTGGASQLAGARDFAQAALQRYVTIGRPGGLRGLPEAMSGPAFSTVAGLVHFAADRPLAVAARSENVTRMKSAQAGGRFARMWRWLEATF